VKNFTNVSIPQINSVSLAQDPKNSSNGLKNKEKFDLGQNCS